MSNHDPPLSPTRSGARGGHHLLRRSITVASPSRLHLHRMQQLHNNQQPQHSHHHHLRKERYADGKPTGSAHPASQMRHSLDMPRPDSFVTSSAQSRRASVLLQGDDDGRPEDSEEKLRQQRENATSRADGLKQSLVCLGNFSTAATRRLDETYYALLEKMSTLQNHVTAMKDLAETSQLIDRDFDKDSQGLESDIVTQLSAVGQFGEQQTKIDSLQSRIRSGREKIRFLSKRVDIVKDRVEGWERADREWQDKTRKRLRIIWSVMSVVVTALIVLLVSVNYTTRDAGRHAPRTLEPPRRVVQRQNTTWRAQHTEPTRCSQPDSQTCQLV